VTANDKYCEQFKEYSAREILEHVAIVNWVDSTLPNMKLLQSIISTIVRENLDPTISREAARLYSQGYEDGRAGIPPKYDILDPADQSEEHF